MYVIIFAVITSVFGALLDQITSLMGFCWIDIVKPPFKRGGFWGVMSKQRWNCCVGKPQLTIASEATERYIQQHISIHRPPYDQPDNTTCNRENENLLNKLKKALAIYSQFETYQFRGPTFSSSIIKLKQFTFLLALAWKSRECSRFSFAPFTGTLEKIHKNAEWN